MDIISICNRKGGVGKTSTAQSIAIGLRKKEKKVLLIDLDPQCNLSYLMNSEENYQSIYEALTKKSDINTLIQPNIDFIKGSQNLSGADIELNMIGKEFRLKECLGLIKSEYDFVIIDTPPSLGILTMNAMVASDYVLIPAQADILSLQGIGQLYETIQAIKHYCNNNIKIMGIIITRFNSRNILSKSLIKTFEETAGGIETILFERKIRESVVIKEAHAIKSNLFKYAPNANITKDYAEIVNAILDIV